MHLTHPAVRFFYDHAGFAYHPGTETSEQGRIRCASALADAERLAREVGARFDWFPDADALLADSWGCNLMLPTADGYSQHLAACIGGVNLGPDRRPGTVPYCRVVEAELALDAIAELRALAAGIAASTAGAPPSADWLARLTGSGGTGSDTGPTVSAA